MTAATMTRPTYCPEWCVESREQHEADLANDRIGFACHWSAPLGFIDGEAITVAAATPRERSEARLTIHVAADTYTLEEAEEISAAFAKAAAMVRAQE